MKPTCVGKDCKALLKMTEERYDLQGNFCQACINKANEALDKKRVDNLLDMERGIL